MGFKLFNIWGVVSQVFLFLFALSEVLGNVPLPPPKGLLVTPLETHKTILVGGGPTNQFPRAIEAIISHPLMGPFEDATIKVQSDIKDGLRYVFQTETPYTFALRGGAANGLDVALDNFIEPGDVVLIIGNGFWGERAADSASRFGSVVKVLRKPTLGSSFPLKEIEEAILLHKPAVVYATIGESTMGVLQRVEGVGEMCSRQNCLVVVDAVAAVGMSPFYMDLWKVDAVLCNSQKGLGTLAGLAPMAYSRRAMDKILRRKTRPVIFYGDIKNSWLPTNFWGLEDAGKPQTPHLTYPVQQMYGLREALAAIAKEGLESIWRRHENATKRLHSGLERMGLEHFVKDPNDRLIGTVAMNPPPGVNPTELMAWIRQKFNLEISSGFGPTGGKILRFGIFGPINSKVEVVDQILQAVKVGLEHFGVKVAN